MRENDSFCIGEIYDPVDFSDSIRFWHLTYNNYTALAHPSSPNVHHLCGPRYMCVSANKRDGRYLTYAVYEERNPASEKSRKNLSLKRHVHLKYARTNPTLMISLSDIGIYVYSDKWDNLVFVHCTSCVQWLRVYGQEIIYHSVDYNYFSSHRNQTPPKPPTCSTDIDIQNSLGNGRGRYIVGTKFRMKFNFFSLSLLLIVAAWPFFFFFFLSIT